MKTPQEEMKIEILSIAGTCNCLTKSPDIKYHQKLCVYQLIVERNSLIEQQKLLIAVARAANKVAVAPSQLLRFQELNGLDNALIALRATRKVEL